MSARKHDWHGAHARLSEQLGRAPTPAEIACELGTSESCARATVRQGRCPKLTNAKSFPSPEAKTHETLRIALLVQEANGRVYMPEVAARLGVSLAMAYRRVDAVIRHGMARKRGSGVDRRSFALIPKSAEADTCVAPGSPATHLPVHSAGVPSGAPASFVREG